MAKLVSSESVDLDVYAQYTCIVSSGSSFLRWNVTGFGTEKLFLFINTDNIGFTRTPIDGFFATLTSTTNGLTSILSFNVTNEHNGTLIICEDPEDPYIDSLRVNIRGKHCGQNLT